MRSEAKGFRLVFGYLGLFVAFEGLVTLFPLLMLFFYPDEWACWADFALPGLIALAIGSLSYWFLVGGAPKARFAKNEDSLLLALLWLMAVLIGAFPFFLTQFPSLNYGNGNLSLEMDFSESFFESVSSYTTTGLTVFPAKAYLIGLDSSPYPCAHVFLFYRAFVQLVGGVGLVLIVASAISDRYNLKLYFAEGHNDRLLPNLRRSAELIFGVYFALVAIGAVGLFLAGMTPFDAFCHAASAIATGGFGTRGSSIAFYQTSDFVGNGVFRGNSLAIEIILMLLMLAGAANIMLNTFLFKGKIKDFCKDIEIRLAFFLIVFFSLASAIGTMYLFNDGVIESLDFPTSLRYSVFNVISSMTTTGFSNYVDNNFLPSAAFSQFAGVAPLGEVAIFSGIILMVIGAGVGSSGGGIKQYRIALMLKEYGWSIKYKFSSPRTVNPHPVTRLGETKEAEPDVLDEARNYAVLYIVFLAAGSFAVMFLPKITCEQGIYVFASAMSDTGLSIIDFVAYKAFSPTSYAWLLWILDIGMFFGRLEIMPIFFGISRLVVDPLEEIRLRRKRSKAKEA